jgi:serine/threonine protein kinase
MQYGDPIDCPNCSKKIVVPKKAFDRGRVIGGDFVIDRILGTGGMGTVYLAKQLSLEREVALKVLSRKFSVDPKFRMEFQREARAASRLTHSNLVQAYAFGEDEGDLFLAMEYVEGVTLGDRLDNETRLMNDEALNIIQQVAEGLHFAWTQEQIIHRDIKPDNIMLTPDGHVKLTDMGLARTAVELENVTEVSGTPAYMNPEQFTKQAMDCRADIYSLGVCLFHSVTGQLPFDSPNVRELARQHIQDKVEFPDKTVDLPTEIKKLIRKMMSKNREERQKDHEKLLHEIFDTRTKLDTGGASIPSVHTLSFNRYEFKNMTPQRKGAANDTQVSSTKQLPRRKIKPLSSATSQLTTSFSTSDSPRSIAAIFMSNLFAVCAIIGAVVMAFMFGGDTESQFYTDTQTFIESIDQSNQDINSIIEKTEELLSREAAGSPNKKDYYARNRLLQIKNRNLKHLLELKALDIERLSKEKSLTDEKHRRQTSVKSQEIASIEIKNKELKDQLNEKRHNFQTQLQGDHKGPKIITQKSSYQEAISDHMLLLQKLWDKEKNKHRYEINKLMFTQKYKNALKYIDDQSKDYSGVYKKWFDRQSNFVTNAEKVRNTVELNLSEIKDMTIELGNTLVTIERVYPQTAEIETAAGNLIKLRDHTTLEKSTQSTKDFIKIYQVICEELSIKKVDGSAYAVACASFNLAHSIAPKDTRIEDYANAYLEDRLLAITRLIEASDILKAESEAIKIYKRCSTLDSESDLRERLTEILGREFFITDEDFTTP